jgi:hypothetical protein
LNHSDTVTGAFVEASKLVDAWETRDHDEHSLPQLASTSRIEAQLKLWRNGIVVGPPVPFIATRPNGGAFSVSR